MEEKRFVLQRFVKDVQDLFGTSLQQIILYGSYARGDYQANSDMDIMILTSLSDQKIQEIENRVYDIAYEYELSDQVTLSINIKNKEHFNYWLGVLPYYDSVKKEGVVLVG